MCPHLKEYMNVSWSKNSDDAGKLAELKAKFKSEKSKKTDVSLVTTPSTNKDYIYEDIMLPDWCMYTVYISFASPVPTAHFLNIIIMWKYLSWIMIEQQIQTME